MSILTNDQRARILDVATGWERTPFHDDANLKGIGVDCAQFVASVYMEAGIVPAFEVPRYQAQWFLHRSEERLMDFVRSYAREIDEHEVLPGDLVLYRLGRAYAHAAIIIDWPNEIIHAHKLSGMVIRARPFDSDLNRTPVKFFSL
jgi:cell wall-associated NlpC family hydrolase